MNWQEFEDRLGAEGQDHQTPVDTDVLWAKIREKKRRRWLPFFWLFAGVGLLVGGGRVVKGISPQEETAFAKETGIGTSLSTGENASLPSVAIVQENTSTIATMQVENTPKTSTPKTSTSTTGKLESAPPVTLRKTKTLDQGDAYVVTMVQPTAGQNQQETGYTQTSSKGTNPAGSTLTPKAGQLPNVVSQDMKANQQTDQPLLFASEEVLPAVKITAVLPIPTLPFLSLLIPVNNPVLVRPQPPVILASVPVPIKNRHGLSIGINAGYFSWNIQRSEPVNSLYPRSQEKVLAAVQIGLQAEFPLAPRWSLRSGV